jgi:S-adenosylhomocysteine hydrolase
MTILMSRTSKPEVDKFIFPDGHSIMLARGRLCEPKLRYWSSTFCDVELLLTNQTLAQIALAVTRISMIGSVHAAEEVDEEVGSISTS